MKKTIVDIERISDCIPKLNIAKSGFYNYPSGKFCSILPFYTICDFYSQSRLNAAKAEMKKTIVDIERISDCIPKLNIAKSGFYNFESGAFNHSATLPLY